MSGQASRLATSALHDGSPGSARLDELTWHLHQRYRNELETAARSAESEKVRRAAVRTLGSLTYTPLAELTYASVASWAVWAETPSGATVKADWATHQPVVERYLAERPALPTAVVFVALNWGVAPGMEIEDWANFHGGPRDYFLADAIRGRIAGGREVAVVPPLPHFHGIYITDFFKGLPTSDGGALRRIAGDDYAELTHLSSEVMLHELTLLGATVDTMLVPLGGGARDAVLPFARNYGFRTPRTRAGVGVEVHHYSYVQPHARFYEQLAAVHASLTMPDE